MVSMGTFLLHTVCSLFLGWLLARIVYRRNWHWHWTGYALVLVVGLTWMGHGLLLTPLLDVPLVAEYLGRWGLNLTLFVATLRGHSFQEHDEKLGGGAGQAIEHSLRPSDAIGALNLSWTVRRGAHQARNESGKLLLGRDRKGPLYIPNGKLEGEHIMVMGPNGEGKSVSQTTILVSRILAGDGAVVLEGKTDHFMLAQVARAAREAGKELIVWSADGALKDGEEAWVWDMFANGGYTELSDRLIADKVWESEHYKAQGELYLLYLIETLIRRGEKLTLAKVIEYIHPKTLLALLESTNTDGEDAEDEDGHGYENGEIGPKRAKHEVRPEIVNQMSITEEAEVEGYLRRLSDLEMNTIAGTLGRLAIAVRADIGRWLDPKTPGTKTFGLLEAIERGAVVYFRLKADKRKDIMTRLTCAIVQDLTASLDELQGRDLRTAVVFDEFQAVPAGNVNNLTARARSAGVTLILATQEIMADVSETLRKQLLSNAKVVIVHRQTLLEAAEYLAGLGGMVWRMQSSVDDRGHMVTRPVQELNIDPTDLMHLPRGAAAVFLPGSRELCRMVRIFSPERQFHD